MKKNLVMTICVGEEYKKIALLTHPGIKEYADKINADFLSIEESEKTTPHWEKFRIFELLNKYERIIYLDTDILIRPDCPDLFKEVSFLKLGMFNEAPFTNGRLSEIESACRDYDLKLKNWNGAYYNSGVMVISRVHKYLFKKPEKEIFNFYEQGFLNIRIAQEIEKGELIMHNLHYKFNRMTCMDKHTGEERFDSYIMHYAGYPSLPLVLSLIEKDKEKWKKDSPNFKYKKHIWIEVQGGLGDQACAEPTIRFAKEKIFKDDEIIVSTHFPRLFSHLNLPVYHHGEVKLTYDGTYYKTITLPGPETLNWRIVSNMLCHTVDYISMSVLRRILKDSEKTISLELKPEDFENLQNVIGEETNFHELILLHPGRHWDSKTFPVEWWQKILDSLEQTGMKVCIIGKEEETRGTQNLKVPEGVIDTRNLLNLGSLIALIALSRILISNDSGPVHLAGAFDNWILLIPSCKFSDHILPYRKETKKYKTISLFKKEMAADFESAPTCVYGSSGETIPGDVHLYLPEPKQVKEAVEKILAQPD